jgi:hypothetical protein
MARREPHKFALLLLAVGVLVLTGWQKRAKENDKFGVEMLFATARSGREWYADWNKKRSVAAFKFDPQDALFRNSEGTLTIGGGVATAPAGRTRFYVMTPKDRIGRYLVPRWKNVEMTAYVRCGTPTQAISGQALDFSARSGERHNDEAPCDGTSYHASLRLDGKCGFKKEVWHTGGYTDLLPEPAPQPWSHVPQNEWIGMKFVCRNCDRDKHVHLQLYVDLLERNEWKLVTELTDKGGWEGKQAGCDRPKDFILSSAYPAVYLRTDFVPIEVKKYSVREIEPLP